MSDLVIRTEGLTKSYGRRRGVTGLELSIRRGEVFGYLGPNGAGKTTTVRTVLDFIRPTRGRASVFGLDTHHDSQAIRRRVGYLPGELVLYENMTGAEVLRYLGHLRGGVAWNRVQELANRLGADLSRPVKTLSHGNRQKIGLINAFMHGPELLVLDEPTLGLDPLVQQTFYELLAEARAEGKTVFLSSHILPEVEKVCDRVAIVRAGALVALETLEALKAKRARRLTLRLREPVEGLRIPGTDLVRQEGLTFEFLVKGDTRSLLAHLAGLPVEDFVFPEPDLEEVFVTYYRGS